MKEKIVKEYIWNPTLELVGYVITETKRTIHNKGKRLGKVDGKVGVIHIDERVKVYKDNSKFIKVYLDSGALLEYNELSKATQRVLAYLLSIINYGEDWVYIIPTNISKHSNVDESRISLYIKELMNKEWLFKTKERGKYWINLCYVCVGDREEMYRKYLNVTK